ncbi:MAG TPA: GntR family transcriptional regulator [Terriglobales bacterium]|nr:GntR family transcriptional regulator [Terriglobales bacterium]
MKSRSQWQRHGIHRASALGMRPSRYRVAVRDTLSEKVYHAFKRDIVQGVYAPGEPLTEKVLAKIYKGSRTPIREAALRLQQERLLRIVPNRGYFISQITLQDLNEVYEYRTAVECAAAELAAQKGAGAEVVSELRKLGAISYRTDDRASYVKFIEADTAFHMGIARLSGNQMLVRAVGDARCYMERIMYAAIDIHYYGEFPTREHQDILKAVQERNPALARQRMYDHIMQSQGKVLRLASSNPLGGRESE